LQEGRCTRQGALAPVSKHGPGEDLPFRPDVPQPGPESDRGGKAGKDQGCRFDQSFSRGAPGAEGALDQRLEGGNGIDADGQEQDRAKNDRRCKRCRNGGDTAAG